MSASASEMRNPTAAQVCLILGICLIVATSAVSLAAMDKDVGAIFAAVGAVAVTVGAAFGWAKASQLQKDLGQVHESVDVVKELSNGRVTQLMDDNRALHEKLTALAMLVQPTVLIPPPPPDQP